MNRIDPWRAEYPFTSHWFQAADNVRLHFVDEGVGDRPIVAVHGNPTWSFYWRKLVSGLSSGRRVLAIDHVGCGLSDKPANYDYSLTRRRDDLLAWCRKLDLKRITLVAHDWGGPIGLSALVQEPERFERVILLNTAAFPPPFVPWRIAMCRTPFLGTLAMRGANLFSQAAIYMTTNRGPLSSVARAGYLAPYDSWANRIAVDRFVKDIPRHPNDPTWQLLADLESRLSEMRHLPAMFIWGMLDWCFRPECLERLLLAMPQAEAVKIADAGHYVMEDASVEVLSAIIAFLQRTDATAPTSVALSNR